MNIVMETNTEAKVNPYETLHNPEDQEGNHAASKPADLSKKLRRAAEAQEAPKEKVKANNVENFKETLQVR